MNSAVGKGILEFEVNREGQRGQATRDDELALQGTLVLVLLSSALFLFVGRRVTGVGEVSSEGFTLKLVTVWHLLAPLTSAFHEITTCFLPSLRLLLLTPAASVKMEIKNLSRLSPALLKSQILELPES